MNRVAWVVVGVAVLVGCRDQSAVTSPRGVSADFADGSVTGGNAHFFFLPPLARQPIFSGAFNPNLRPVVDICQLVVDASGNPLQCDAAAPEIDPGTVQLDPIDQLYQVNWQTDQPAVDLTKFYRIQVRGAPRAKLVLGFADIAPVANGSALKNVNTGQYIGLVDGRTLPIKFRIENGAFCKTAADCGEATIGAGGGTVITNTGLAGALFPPGALAADVVVAIETVTERPCLPIDLLQRSGCYQFSTDPGPNTFTQQVTAGICVDIEGLTPIEISLLHLHQLDFVEEVPVVTPLPNVAAQFLTCDAPHPPPTSVGLGGRLERSVRALMSLLTPQPLFAAHLGVGGLTGSFSRIGWALPAQISIRAGDGQTAPTGTAVTTPPSVIVKDSSGAPVPGEAVTFSVGSGGGSVTGGGATTDATGVATVGSWTLGPSAGANTLIATSRGAVGSRVTFTATGTLGFTATRLSAGWLHTCAVTTGGAAYCWGDNSFGELGNGTTTGSTAPAPVSGGLTFTTISAGIDFTCGITTTQAAYCWGDNSGGKLGTGTTTSTTAPAAVSSNASFATISAGDIGACAVTTGGAVYCWGGSNTAPVLASGDLTFVMVSASSWENCGVAPGGAAYCWGDNSFGELGNGTTTGSAVPVAVSGGLSLASVTSGARYACGTTTSGAAYCWGDNADGELGIGTTTGPEQCASFAGTTVPCSTTPVPVSGGVAFAAVTAFAGIFHTCGVTTAGAAYCWGPNFYGEIGVAPPTSATAPVPVPGGLRFVAVSTGQTHTCGITTSGAVYCWGANYVGQLGIGTTVGPQFCSSSAGTGFSCSPIPVLVTRGLSSTATPTARSPGP